MAYLLEVVLGMILYGKSKETSIVFGKTNSFPPIGTLKVGSCWSWKWYFPKQISRLPVLHFQISLTLGAKKNPRNKIHQMKWRQLSGGSGHIGKMVGGLNHCLKVGRWVPFFSSFMGCITKWRLSEERHLNGHRFTLMSFTLQNLTPTFSREKIMVTIKTVFFF